MVMAGWVARGGDATPRWRRRSTIAAVCAVMMVVVLAVASRAGHALIVCRTLAEPDAIVALGSHEWERLPAVAQLAQRAPAATVLLSEPLWPNEWNCHDCAYRVERLVQAGVEEDRIVGLARKVERTFDEATAVREWAEQHGARSVMVVTSPYHTRRALATFEHAFEGTGVQVGVYPTRADSPARPEMWWWHRYDRWYVAYEWSATVFYMLRFGVFP
jgi:uncharacterized SAM-binding protein YcdF (DUF218 family)